MFNNILHLKQDFIAVSDIRENPKLYVNVINSIIDNAFTLQRTPLRDYLSSSSTLLYNITADTSILKVITTYITIYKNLN